MDIPSKRLKNIKGDNFEANIEYGANLVAIHLPFVSKFDRSTYLEMKFMLEDWDGFFKHCGFKDTYVAFDTNDTKIKKLVNMLGFEYLVDNEGLAIYRYLGE